MKVRNSYKALMLAMAVLTACSTGEQAGEKSKAIKEISKVETVKTDYSIPEKLESVSKYKDGYTPAQTMQFRNTYGPTSAITADDIGSYASTHLSEVVKSAVVHRQGNVSHLESEISEEIADVAASTILGTMTLKEMMDDERSRMKAITVIHDGKIVYEDYRGIRDWDNHLWASATKIFTGTLLHIAEEEGLVNLQANVPTYLTDLKGTAWDNVKVEDALHMRAGLDISESRLGSSPTHPTTMLYAITGGHPSYAGQTLLDAVKKSERNQDAGERFEYASINTHVGTLILQEVYNMPIEDLISTKIWSKTGMEGDAVLGLSEGGEPMSFGAFAARLRDLGRFGMLFTPSWDVVANEQVVSDSYFGKAKAASKPEAYGNDYMSQRLTNDFGETGFGASYQWDAVFEDGDLYKSGRTGQCLYVSPETNTVVVWYSSAYQAEVWVHAYAREIVKQMYR